MKSLRLLTSAGLVAGGLAVIPVMLTSGASAAATTVPNCTSAHLRVSLGQPQGTAGTIYYPIVFTNTGAACAIWGVAKVQPVLGGTTHSQKPVGPPARNNSMGEMPVRHVVAAHHSVSDPYGVVESGNYSSSACAPKSAGAIEVSLGAFLTHRYLALKISVCTKLASTTTSLIVPGSTGA